MKNTIFLDTGIIGLYQSNHEEIVEEIKTKITNQYKLISSPFELHLFRTVQF